MENNKTKLLEDILVIEILRLAQEMKNQRNSTGDFTKEAIKIFQTKRVEVLYLLSQQN